MLPLSGRAAPTALFASAFNEADPRFSPDGRAIAFTSDESGRTEAYLAPFPPTGVKKPVSGEIYTGVDRQVSQRLAVLSRDQFRVNPGSLFPSLYRLEQGGKPEILGRDGFEHPARTRDQGDLCR